MNHYDTLIAHGISPEQAARDSYANDIQFWRNRELPQYGRYEPDPPSAEEVRQAFHTKYIGD